MAYDDAIWDDFDAKATLVEVTHINSEDLPPESPKERFRSPFSEGITIGIFVGMIMGTVCTFIISMLIMLTAKWFWGG